MNLDSNIVSIEKLNEQHCCTPEHQSLMTKNSDLLRKISEIEQAVKELRLEIERQEQETPRAQIPIDREPRVGDIVRILNPKKGQENTGTICKYN